jgi:hypothetical protein
MTVNFEEDKFINEIVNFYIQNDISYHDKKSFLKLNENYSVYFDIYFIKMTKSHNCKLILESYCSKEEIEDAKERFKNDYVELKLSLILYHKFLNELRREQIYRLYLKYGHNKLRNMLS